MFIPPSKAMVAMMVAMVLKYQAWYIPTSFVPKFYHSPEPIPPKDRANTVESRSRAPQPSDFGRPKTPGLEWPWLDGIEQIEHEEGN